MRNRGRGGRCVAVVMVVMAAAATTAANWVATAPDAGNAAVLEDRLDVERVAAEFEVLFGALGCFGV